MRIGRYRIVGLRDFDSLRRATPVVVTIWFLYSVGYHAITGDRFGTVVVMAALMLLVNVIEIGSRIALAIERKPVMVVHGGLDVGGPGASLIGLHIEHTGSAGVRIENTAIPIAEER